MQRDIFAAGTAPGSPTTPHEVKTLICYLLTVTEEPMTFEHLHEALRENNLVNYFELIEGVDSLVESGHILPLPEGDITTYAITNLGRATAETLDTSLPLSVREKAMKAAGTIVERRKRLHEVKATIKRLDTGSYQVDLAIPEGKSNLISCSLFAPTRTEAEKIRRGFLNDPVFLYQAILSLLMGDFSVLGDLKPTENPLF